MAEAHFQLGEHKKAEAQFKEVLHGKKHLGKSRQSKDASAAASEDGVPNDLAKALTDIALKLRLHECYLRLGQQSAALTILQSIPAKQRTAKSNMALGSLYQKAGMERPAVTCFREVRSRGWL